MENISIYLSDSENLYYLIFLSLLISIFIIAYRKRDINLYLLCKKYLQRYFNLIRNYFTELKLRKLILSDKYKIRQSDKICWVVLDNKIVEINENYLNLCNSENLQEVIKNNEQLIPIQELENNSNLPSKKRVIIGGEQYVFTIKRIKKNNSYIYSAIDCTEEENHYGILSKQNESNLHLMNQLTDPVTIYGQDESLVFFNMSFKIFSSLEENYLAERPNESEILDNLRYKNLIPTQVNFAEWKKKQLDIYKTLDNREQWWYLPDGRTIRVISQPNPMGGVTHIYENHTDRLALENETKLLSSIQKQTIDNLSEGIALFGTDGKVKLINPKFIGLWNVRKNIEGIHIKQLLKIIGDEINKDLFDDIYRNVVSSGLTRRDHSGIINYSNDKIIFYKSSILPDGSILYTFTDITDSYRIEEALKEKNDALIQADKIKTIFMNNISYELRAPLQNIIGFSELLEDKMSKVSKKEQRSYISDIKKSGNELHYQINQILEITSLESGKISLQYKKIPQKEFVNLIQDELDKLDFLNYNFKLVTKDIQNTANIYLDTNYIPRIFTGVIKLFNKKNISNDYKEINIKFDIEFKNKNYVFIFNLLEKFDEFEYQLSDVNDEYIYSQGDIESTIIQKYIEYFNGEIQINSKQNQIIVKLPKMTP
ncbi:MAG: PAS-domain containing protein [Hyphomicrobiales bacterium]|nr:PAS-domain containing protein [Hyphomicrobiales bacterium]